MTDKEAYTVLRMDECLDCLGERRTFSTTDANSGYWQIKIDEITRDKTASTSNYGLQRFIRVPFGLKNPPCTFQRAMDVFLTTVKGQLTIVDSDDIFIFPRTVHEHFDHLRTVSECLSIAR